MKKDCGTEFILLQGTGLSPCDIKGSERLSFSSGEDIALPSGIVFVIRGSVKVTSKEKNVLLNIIREGGTFGASTLFNEKSTADTCLTAGNSGAILVHVNEEAFVALLQSDGQMLKNYLGFVSRRICFLSGKVGTFSSQTSEEKLLHHIMQNGGSISVKSMTQLSLMLSMGRASLYRAVAVLEEEGKIKREGKTLTLI